MGYRQPGYYQDRYARYEKREEKYRETRTIIEKVKNMKSLTELSQSEFAGIDGWAAKIAKELKDDLKTTQLRKFFDPLVNDKSDLEKKKRSWNEVKGTLYAALPLLAYSVGRGLAPDVFRDLMETCIKKALSESDERGFLRFMEFLEAIVAYDTYYEKVRERERGGD
ncbi:MAG: type III-A CRISPR-associated protein Csm2 [Candidatus Methanomethylicota archaeon]|jgi:CRISPR type III-A-associated protein Csm2|uniref:CRISPR system Cms protein Csm2 n=1 Tax=Thermoproteota archaeon TaxID=2056631 RepID=A0A523B9F7_9CREN|nr:MAG: type III-A CRISPR-associated protein Csm2 [Candidatus Verstraetearchaeota archaeon]